jgi:hypothetical protein
MNAKQSTELAPEWANAALAGEGSAAFFAAAGLAPDTVRALEMVACELFENAVKYGAFEGRATISVECTLKRSTASIEVRHAVSGATQRHLRRLDEMVQWIRGFQDPYQAYLERLKHVSQQALAEHESGLGLVRIAYEGRAIVDFVLDRDGMLSVCALHRAGR